MNVRTNLVGRLRLRAPRRRLHSSVRLSESVNRIELSPVTASAAAAGGRIDDEQNLRCSSACPMA